MRPPRWLIPAATVLLLFVWGMRVYVVNASAERIPQELYGQGEWLEPGEGYLIDDGVEDLDGFSLRLDGAHIMSPREYIEKYGKHNEAKPEDDSVKSVLAVTITVKNTSNERGGFEGWLWTVIPASKNCAYSFDADLFTRVEATGGRFRVGLGKEVTRTFPFRRQDLGPYLTDSAGRSFGKVADRSFHLNITYRPITKRFVFSADG